MALATIAVTAAVTAATATTVAVANYSASRGAANAQRNLADDQANQLRIQQEAANNEAAAQAGTGLTFGRETSTGTMAKDFGFGTGDAGAPNSAGSLRGSLTGMG